MSRKLINVTNKKNNKEKHYEKNKEQRTLFGTNLGSYACIIKMAFYIEESASFNGKIQYDRSNNRRFKRKH